MSDREPDATVKPPGRKRKPPRVPKSRRGRPAKYQFIWQLMADEARLAKMMKQSESVDGVVDAWTPATEGATTTGATRTGATYQRLESSSTVNMDSNSDQHMQFPDSQPNTSVAKERFSDHSISSIVHPLRVYPENLFQRVPPIEHRYQERLAGIMPIPYPSRRMSLLDTPSSLNGNPSYGNWLPVNYGKQLLSVTAVSETSKFGSSISAEHNICPIPLPSLQYIKEFGRRHNGPPCLVEVSRSDRTGMQCYMENCAPPHHQSSLSNYANQTWNDKTTNHGTTFEIRNKLGNALDLSNKSTRSPDPHDTTQTPLQAFDHIPGSVPRLTDSEPSVACDRQQETLLTPLKSCIPSLRPLFRAIDSSLPTFGEHHQDIIQTHPQSFRLIPHRSTCKERSVYSSVTRSNSPTQPGEEEEMLEPAIQLLLRQQPQKIVLWDVDRVVQFVSSIQGCQEYCDVFRQHEIDGFCLLDLDQKHLLDIFKMKLGPSMRLLKTIAYIHKLEQI